MNATQVRTVSSIGLKSIKKHFFLGILLNSTVKSAQNLINLYLRNLLSAAGFNVDAIGFRVSVHADTEARRWRFTTAGIPPLTPDLACVTDCIVIPSPA
jgi:hypothetical protein